MEFLAKVHCLREASEVNECGSSVFSGDVPTSWPSPFPQIVFSSPDNGHWFAESGRRALSTVIQQAGKVWRRTDIEYHYDFSILQSATFIHVLCHIPRWTLTANRAQATGNDVQQNWRCVMDVQLSCCCCSCCRCRCCSNTVTISSKMLSGLTCAGLQRTRVGSCSGRCRSCRRFVVVVVAVVLLLLSLLSMSRLLSVLVVVVVLL